MNRRLVFHMLLVALFLCIGTASGYNVVDEIVEYVLDKRQNNGGRNTTTTHAAPTSDPPPEETTTTTHTTKQTTVITTPPTTTRRVTTVPQTTDQATTSAGPVDEPTTEEGNGGLTTPASPSSPTPETTELQPTTRFSTQTRGVATITLTISSMIAVSTLYTKEVQTIVETPTRGLSSGSGDSGSGGISRDKKGVIIGVVVGVGGAIIIGALLIVAFRLRKRKSIGAADSDELQGSPSSAGPSRQQDAFKATLDQYHKPPGTVNPSANF